MSDSNGNDDKIKNLERKIDKLINDLEKYEGEQKKCMGDYVKKNVERNIRNLNIFIIADIILSIL